MKKILKILTHIILSLLILLALAGLFMQTPVFKGWLKNLLAETISEAMPGELSIGKMSGNLFSRLEFEDVCIRMGDDTLLVCPELHLKFDLTSLLDNVIEVQELHIVDPEIRLCQDTLGVWNATSVLLERDSLVSTDTDAGQDFGYTILAGSVVLSDATVLVHDRNEFTPETISHFNLQVNGKYSDSGINVILDSLFFNTSAPDLVLRNMSLEFFMSPDSFSLKNIRVHTGKNFLSADLQADQNPPVQGHIRTELDQVDVSEFEVFFPGITMGNKPDLTSDIRVRNDSAIVSLKIVNGGQFLSLNGVIGNYRSLLQQSNGGKVGFKAGLELERFNSRDWLNIGGPQFGLSGQMDVTGSFSGFEDLQATAKGSLAQIRFDRYFARQLDFSSIWSSDLLQAQAMLISDYGDVNLNIRVTKPGERNLFSGNMQVRHLALETITGNDSLTSDLNFALDFSGRGVPPELNHADIDLEMYKSVLAGNSVENLSSHLEITGENYILDSLIIKHRAADISVSGKGILSGPHDLAYTLRLKDPQVIADMFSTDSLTGTGYFTGNLAGMIDSLNSEFQMELAGIRYDNIRLEKFSGTGNVLLKEGLLLGEISVKVDTLEVAGNTIDQVRCAAVLGDSILNTDIDVIMDRDISFSFRAEVRQDTVIMINVPEMGAKVFKDNWSGRIDQLVLDQGYKIQISGCRLESENAHSVFIDGTFSRQGRQDLMIVLRNLDVNRVLAYTGNKPDLGGNLDFDLNLSGPARDPVVEGFFTLHDGFSKNMKFKGLGGKFAYQDREIIVSNVLKINDTDSLLVLGRIPFHMSFSEMIFQPDDEKDIDLRITSGRIPIGLFLNNLSNIDAVSGFFFCDLQIKNKIDDLKISGTMTIADAALKSDFWGVDLQKMDMELVAEDNLFRFNRFQIKRDAGTVDLSGDFTIDPADTSNIITKSSLNLTAKDFFLLKHRDFEIQITSDLNYTGQKGRPVISGELIVNRSSFYLPVIMGRFGAVSTPEQESKPMLVRAKENLNPDTLTTGYNQTGEEINTPGFLDKLKGNLNISIPRNTWVKNPQLRVELGGNLNLYLDEGQYLLSGPVEIVRGQYDILGRRFTVLEGKIDFQGRKDVYPPVSLVAEYTYRETGRDKKTLVLKVSGDLRNPVISFLENNSEITQDDAISIILFNRKKDELNFSSQADMASSDIQSAAAMGLVSNLVSDRLSRKLGDDLKLDVIEINAQDNWQGANFIVGKYITNDIFVTYKREFGQSTDNEIVPETISLEYEITKFLFFQMLQGDPKHSGIDLLFKFDID